MMKRAVLSLLLLSACTPAAAPPQDAVAPAAAPPAETSSPVAEKAAPADEIKVDAPVAGARVSSPLVATGSAENTWYFEGQFQAQLEIGGKVVVEAPAMQNDPEKAWTDPGQIKFRAELPFSVSQPTEAVLVLSEDMPVLEDEDGDERGPAKTIRIPVTLAPAPEH